MKRLMMLGVAIMLATGGAPGPALGQAPIESELALITPVSKFIHDAALKAFADYAKEKWNVTVKVSAIPAGTPVAYGRIVEWKGKPEVDIFWGGESALFEKLTDVKLHGQNLLQNLELAKEGWETIPPRTGNPQPSPHKGQKSCGGPPPPAEPGALLSHQKKTPRRGTPEPREWDDLLNPKLK